MNFRSLYSLLDKHKYYVFSLEDILSFFPDEGRSNLKRMLSRWKKKGWLAPLKKGMYELTYPKDLTIPDMFIANRLYSPSYVSLETALSHFSMIPEVSMAVTSITTKPTRRFQNKHGLFIYRTAKPQAYSGYFVETLGGFNVRIAEPEKALVDFVYFKTYRGQKVSLSDERVDKSSILRSLNKRKLRRYLRFYRLQLEDLYACL